MTSELVPVATLVALVVILALAVATLLALRRQGSAAVRERLESFERALERGERSVREELARSREEAARAAQQQRLELVEALAGFGTSVQASVGLLGVALERQLASFAQQLDAVVAQVGRLAEGNERRLVELQASLDTRLVQVGAAVDAKLAAIQQDNEKRLEQIRQTVDEKLQGTLELRLGESFRTVSAQLAQVHEGLGEMQKLAAGVGDLKRVLTNVKARGTWGEVQLGALLEQTLTSEQFARNVATREGSKDRVEFAIRLPGRDEDRKEPVWLPIDAKFPVEDYQRLVEAAERADAAGVEQAGKQLEARIWGEAEAIRDKYLDPPNTTDFGIMFLPTEGLYAEVLRRPGLVEQLQRRCQVMVTGPTTLTAVLTSLQMGFRTLAIERRSSEVWKVLGAVKTEFGKFGEVIDRVQKKLLEASNTIDDAARRRRAVERKLRAVEALPAEEASALLPAAGEGEPGEET